jgi:hypothetical protein
MGDVVIHELRIYESSPGRILDLSARFMQITVPIWKRIGIRPLGFWTTIVGRSSNTLVYLLEWESLAERERLWPLFMNDPEWLERKAHSDRNGVLVVRAENQLLQPTSYSAIGGDGR